MKPMPIEEVEALSPEIHAAASRVGCTEVRVSAPIWPGPSTEGPAGEELRVVEYSWSKALLLRGEAIFDENDTERFLAVLEQYGLAEVESFQPSKYEAATMEATVAPEQKPAAVEKRESVALNGAAPAPRDAFTVYILPETKRRLEEQANQAGLSPGALLDRILGRD